MRVAMIGAGNVGRALAGSFVKAGHEVWIAAVHPEHADAVARDIGARAVPGNADAAANADVIVLAVPASALEDALSTLGDVGEKVVIDTTNRVDTQDPGAVLDGTSTTETLQRRLGATPVVKAFNTLFASNMADPRKLSTTLDGFVAGDDGKARATVCQLVASIGLRPVDCGGAVFARVLEGMALLNITLQVQHQGAWESAWQMAGSVPGTERSVHGSATRSPRRSGTGRR